MGASMDCVGADASVASVGGAIISAIIEESEVLERIAVKRSIECSTSRNAGIERLGVDRILPFGQGKAICLEAPISWILLLRPHQARGCTAH